MCTPLSIGIPWLTTPSSSCAFIRVFWCSPCNHSLDTLIKEFKNTHFYGRISLLKIWYRDLVLKFMKTHTPQCSVTFYHCISISPFTILPMNLGHFCRLHQEKEVQCSLLYVSKKRTNKRKLRLFLFYLTPFLFSAIMKIKENKSYDCLKTSMAGQEMQVINVHAPSATAAIFETSHWHLKSTESIYKFLHIGTCG